MNSTQGVDKDKFLKEMFKLMIESLMEGERTAFLGYDPYNYNQKKIKKGNSRNGYYERDLLTGLGNLERLNIPRDRDGKFDSALLDRWKTATTPMENLISALYSKGMSTRDIEDTVKQIYGKDLSPQYISNITKEVEEERVAWQKRRLKPRYTAIFVDALFVPIRRDTVARDAVYVIAGIDDKGYRDILGFYVGAEESARFWKDIFVDIKERGVDKVLLFVFDGLTGLKETIHEQFPRSLTQLCVVHQMRNTLNKVRPAHKEQIALALKSVYKSKTIQEAKDKLMKLKIQWSTKYPKLFNRWVDKLEYLMRFLEFPEYLRGHLYSTNWLERLNKEFRKMFKTKNSLPTENSVLNLMYFKTRDLSRRYQDQRLNGFVHYQVDIDFLWEKQYGGGDNV